MAIVREGSIHRYVGLSTDVKPTGGVPTGSRFFEADSGVASIYNGAAWKPLAGAS